MSSSAPARFLGGTATTTEAGHGAHVLIGFGWGALSASSLIFGAAIGIVRLPSERVRAALMAFGAGALIQALSIELFAHIIAKARGGHGGHDDSIDRGLIFAAIGAALLGGLLFAGLDRVLNEHGAFLRKGATVQAYFRRMQYRLQMRIIRRLKKVPMFEVLTDEQLLQLSNSMSKVRYKQGGEIFSELSSESSIFFLLSGRVELTITTRYNRGIGNGNQGIGEHSSDGSPMSSPDKGEERVVNDRFMLRPNDIFGEMALFTSEPVEAKAVAMVPSCALKISSTALHKLLASNRRMQDFVAMTAIDRLRETNVFRRCTPSTVARLVSFMKQAEFEAGDVLFFDIDAFSPIYFVVIGCVELLPSNQAANDEENAEKLQKPVRVNDNELLGTDHLVLGHPVPRMARAVERTTVLIIQRSDIDKLCESDERFRQALLRSGSVRMEDINFVEGDVKTEHPAVSLVPPEGMAPPSKFSAMLDMGWQKKTDDDDDQNSSRAARTPPVAFRENTEGPDDEVSIIGDVKDDPLNSLTDLPDLLENEEAAKGHGDHHGSRGVQAAIMIWLGIMIDAIPESVVMGILVNSATTSTLLTFVCGVFIANFPEAMSSAGTMYQHGMKRPVIMLMWTSIVVLTGIGALFGTAIFPPGSAEDPTTGKIIACVEGLAGGAMLCMIANTVLPEAFEQGGNVTGLSCLCGFLVAITISCIQ